MIPIFSNTLGTEEISAIASVFKSRWLGRGKECAAFEREFAEHLRTDHALLTNCCTAALYIALQSLGISYGDEVIVSTINFVACASAILEMGAKPVFADVDPHTLNILPSEIERLRTPRTKAVLLLHYSGCPVPMHDIWAVSHGLKIVEDSANAVASTYFNQACGTLGDAGVWSFDAMKILVMGDGGALWMRDPERRQYAEALRYLGLAPTRSSGTDSAGKGGSRWWEFEMIDASGRFISNDVMASVGRIQLRKLSAFIERRRQIWRTYQIQLAGVDDLILPPEPLDDCTTSYYLYWVQTGRRDELARYLYDNDIYTTFRYYPLHLVQYFGSDAFLPNAERANRMTLCLPLHQNLSNGDVDKIITLVRRFYRG